jgi:hypothetical protein
LAAALVRARREPQATVFLSPSLSFNTLLLFFVFVVGQPESGIQINPQQVHMTLAANPLPGTFNQPGQTLINKY